MEQEDPHYESSNAEVRPISLREGSGLLQRLSCETCRRRKLRCDRQQPRCDSCTKRGFECVYGKPKIRKIVPPDYAYKLEQRLARVETRLQDAQRRIPKDTEDKEDSCVSNLGEDDYKSLEENYFAHFHATLPIIHKERYFESFKPTCKKQPLHLRHAVCAVAASVSGEYAGLHESLYILARRGLEDFEMHTTVPHQAAISELQAWILVSNYEFRNLHLYRAWISTGRCVRIAQMMCLHQQDKQSFKSNSTGLRQDWTDAESRRRAFWATFCLDRQASIGYCWPLSLDERDICTLLPVADEAYQASRETRGVFLQDAAKASNVSLVSAHNAYIMLTAFWSRRLCAIKRLRETPADPLAVTVPWMTNSFLESALTTTFSLPRHLRERSFVEDPLLLSAHMIAEAGTIHVQYTALDAAHESGVVVDPKAGSDVRRREAATSILRLWNIISRTDPRKMPPFITFCLYVAATVFARSLAVFADPEDQSRFDALVSGMIQLKATIPLSQTFLDDLKNDYPQLADSIEWFETSASFTLASTQEDADFLERLDMSGMRETSEFDSLWEGMNIDYATT